MSALDDLSPIARHALWASCMASDVPVSLADPGAVERVAALLRRPAPAGDATRPPAGSPGGRITFAGVTVSLATKRDLMTNHRRGRSS